LQRVLITQSGAAALILYVPYQAKEEIHEMNFTTKMLLASVSTFVLFCHLSASDSSDSSDSLHSSDSSDSSDSDSLDCSSDTDTHNKPENLHPGTCPPFTKMCMIPPPRHLPSGCSDDDDCKANEKCCKDCYVFKCKSAIIAKDTPHPGTCPRFTQDCIRRPRPPPPGCTHDSDCLPYQKCCAACPVPKCKTTSCPSTAGHFGSCTISCQSDSACRARNATLCCKTACGGAYCL